MTSVDDCLLDYFRDDVVESVEGDFYDWLVVSTCKQLKRGDLVQQAASNLIHTVPYGVSKLHHHYLTKEQNRLAKIKAAEDEKKRKFNEERAVRRANRQLQRLSRTKRRLKEEIETKIYSKKSFETDVISLKLVSYCDEDPEPKKFRTYVGILYELWAMLSKVRETVNSRVEIPLEKFLHQDEDIRKFILNFLSDPGLKERHFRININEKYKPQVEEALHLMDTNLVLFNEQKETLIDGLVNKKDLVVGKALSLCLVNQKFEPIIYHWLLVNLLRIFFKSNDYKIADESSLHANETTLTEVEIKPEGGDDDLKGDNQADGFLKPEEKPLRKSSYASGTHLGIGEEGSKTNMSQLQKNSARNNTKGPEITDEDRRIEALKRKLDIKFVPQEQQISSETVAVFRVRETLNREVMRPDIVQKIEEERQKKKEEAEAVHDPKKELAYHKKQYLLDEYLRELKAIEEQAREAEVEAERKKKELYIEQYYGDAYENEFKKYDYEGAERAASNINEGLSLGGDRDVIFIHRVNQGLFRNHIIDKIRETFKEAGLIKDVDIDRLLQGLDKEIEQTVLPTIVVDKDLIPIFDAEL